MCEISQSRSQSNDVVRSVLERIRSPDRKCERDSIDFLARKLLVSWHFRREKERSSDLQEIRPLPMQAFRFPAHLRYQYRRGIVAAFVLSRALEEHYVCKVNVTISACNMRRGIFLRARDRRVFARIFAEGGLLNVNVMQTRDTRRVVGQVRRSLRFRRAVLGCR